jgi:hypothetical protein
LKQGTAGEQSNENAVSPAKGMILASITICRPFFTASFSTAGRDRQPETRNPKSVTRNPQPATNPLVSEAAVG